MYGVVTMPFSVREGINIFLAGFIPSENLRFRDTALSFKVANVVDDEKEIEVRWFAPSFSFLCAWATNCPLTVQ